MYRYRAAGNDWFPAALNDGVRSLLLKLPPDFGPGGISSFRAQQKYGKNRRRSVMRLNARKQLRSLKCGIAPDASFAERTISTT